MREYHEKSARKYIQLGEEGVDLVVQSLEGFCTQNYRNDYVLSFQAPTSQSDSITHSPTR